MQQRPLGAGVSCGRQRTWGLPGRPCRGLCEQRWISRLRLPRALPWSLQGCRTSAGWRERAQVPPTPALCSGWEAGPHPETGSTALGQAGGSGAAVFLAPHRGAGRARPPVAPLLVTRWEAKGLLGEFPAPLPAEPARCTAADMPVYRGLPLGPCAPSSGAGLGPALRPGRSGQCGAGSRLPSVPCLSSPFRPSTAEFLRVFLKSLGDKVIGGFLSAFLLADVPPDECPYRYCMEWVTSAVKKTTHDKRPFSHP